jgi:hypothetical protein
MSNGFLSPDQLDRVNLKTMAQGGIPEPYSEGDIFASLMVVKDWYLNEGPKYISRDDATAEAVEWYCSNPTETIVKAFVRFNSNPLYQNTKLLVEAMHQNPDLVEKAIRLTENGWRPPNEETNE